MNSWRLQLRLTMNAILIVENAGSSAVSTNWLANVVPNAKITPLASSGALQIFSVKIDSPDTGIRILDHLALLEEGSLKRAYWFLEPSTSFQIRGESAEWINPYPA